jgi:hypothetical protein
VTGRRERRRKKQLDNLMVKTVYGKLKEKALDRTVWRARCGRIYGPCRKTSNRKNENNSVLLVSLTIGRQLCTWKLHHCSFIPSHRRTDRNE